ncbi:MAG: type II secretion system minor pseudopilin GspK [Acidiferrobacterales bacterium]
MADRFRTSSIHRSQNGVAMITALLIVAIATTVAASLSLGQQVWLRQAQNLLDHTQASAVRSGVIEWAAIILTKDAKDNQVDDLTEEWATALPPLPAEGGLVAGNIHDAQGRFNLNNLVRGGNASTNDIAVFQRLLESQELPRELADAVVDWLDSDSQSQPNGAEDVDYLSNERPYRAANQLLHSVNELRLIKGFDAKAVERLRPLVTALPQITAININTASAIVFGALFSELSFSEAENLLKDREDRPFKSADDLKQRLPTDVAPPKVSYDVRSSFFEVRVDSLFGRLQQRARALLLRTENAPVRVIWQQRELVVTEADQEPSADEG